MNTRQTQSNANRLQAEPSSDADWSQAVKRMGLSDRQAEVLALLLNGMKDKEIAQALRISYHTVRAHVRVLFARENVGTRMKLVARVNVILRECSESRIARIG